MLKRILTILLAIAMVFSMCAMAGCKDNGGNGGKPAVNPGNSQAEDEYFLDMPSELRGTTVKFATWIDHAKTDTAICLSGFEETTGMKYELFQVNQSDYVVKMAGYISADQSPDVVVDVGNFPKTLNLLQPLSKETNGLDATDPFWDQRTSELFHIGNNYYLVNGANSSWLMMDGAMTYFHKTLLEENGIKTPADYVAENNWNTDTLWTLLTQIKSSCGLTTAPAYIAFDTWLNTYGGGQYKFNQETDKFENAIQTTESKMAIDYLMRGKDAGLIKIISNHEDGITKAAHAVQIAGAYGLRKSPGWFYTMDVDDLGFAVPPKLNADDADYPYAGSTRAYGICKGAKNAKGAAYFLRYFLNQEHYDMDQMFKTEEAKEMYLKLREKGDINKVTWSDGVGRVTDPSYYELTFVQDLIDGTAAQVGVNLASVSSKLDGAAAAANKLLADILAAQ